MSQELWEQILEARAEIGVKRQESFSIDIIHADEPQSDYHAFALSKNELLYLVGDLFQAIKQTDFYSLDATIGLVRYIIKTETRDEPRYLFDF